VIFIANTDRNRRIAKPLLLRLWINLWEGRELAPQFADRYNAGARRGVPTQASAP